MWCIKLGWPRVLHTWKRVRVSTESRYNVSRGYIGLCFAIEYQYYQYKRYSASLSIEDSWPIFRKGTVEINGEVLYSRYVIIDHMTSTTILPRSLESDVISTPSRPHGVIWSNQLRSVLQFRATPCRVTYRLAFTPVGMIISITG